MVVEGSICKDGLLSFESWVGLPNTRNSVLAGFKDRRLADIQVDI